MFNTMAKICVGFNLQEENAQITENVYIFWYLSKKPYDPSNFVKLITSEKRFLQECMHSQ